MRLKVGKKYWVRLKHGELIKVGDSFLYDVYARFKDKPLLAETCEGIVNHICIRYIDKRLKKNFYVYNHALWNPNRFHITEIESVQLEFDYV